MVQSYKAPSSIPSCTFRTGKATLRPRCAAHAEQQDASSRRTVLQGTGAALLTLVTPKEAWSASKTQATNVGSYLPKAGDGDFVQFKPSDTQTPVS